MASVSFEHREQVRIDQSMIQPGPYGSKDKKFFEAPAHALTHRKDRICIVLGDRQSDRLYIGMRIVIRIEVAHDKRRLCSKPFSMLKTAVAVYNKVIAPKIASDARVICDACSAYDHASVILFLFSFEFFHTLTRSALALIDHFL